MALVQITEAQNVATTRATKSFAAGIDLGTTNSLVATVQEGAAAIIPCESGQHSLPSVVHYAKAVADTVVGHAAEQFLVNDPLNTIVSVKRLLGRKPEELAGLLNSQLYQFVNVGQAVAQIQTAAGIKTPIEVSSDILTALTKQACAHLEIDALDGVVITVPAYFDDAQRQATKDAATLAGLKVLRLLNEPTAAAVAYALDQKKQGTIVVFDLGGGTFDVSILRLEKGVFKVLATGGDTALGGDDFDRLIAEDMMRTQPSQQQQTVSASLSRHLLQSARTLKEALSSEHAVACDIEIPGEIPGEISSSGNWQYEVNREQFEGLIEPLLERMLKICRHLLEDTQLTHEQIDEVVMVGGATRTPCIQARVAEVFGKTPRAEIDPDTVVAMGAAIQADVLVGNKQDNEMLLLDVVPLSLGIETIGGLVEKIIPRNTVIPAQRVQTFTSFRDGQTGISIHVVQGERELVEDCRSLAKFELKGIPPAVAGSARVQVTFQVDADGLLSVTARETATGVTTQVEVRPSYGLSDTELEQMLRQSIAHSKEDIQMRILRERQIEATQLLESMQAVLRTDGDELLSEEERKAIDQALQDLRAVAQKEDGDAIRQRCKALEQCSAEYISRRMDRSIRSVMQGKSLEDF